MTTGAYLRFPHLCGDLVTFVADDDVWLAPIAGGRAWRFTADRTPVSNPRLSPDGARIAWTSTREGAPEAFAAELDGPEGERLTHWGSPSTQVRGWSADGQVHVVSAAGQGGRTRTWAHAVPLDGGPATRLPYGWVSEVAVSGDRVVTVSPMWREPSQWKRYRGGTAGKIWIDAEGSGEFTRLFADNPAQHWAAMWIGDRIAFLADTDGIGNLYSTLPDGSDPRRHTGHEEFYARHATTDGERIVYSHAGDLWLLESLDAEPYRL
ncbi:peptidase S41, partial [Nonomuraea ferruginea]|nr:peptidase S41 [Nonomuraea ferruginea]